MPEIAPLVDVPASLNRLPAQYTTPGICKLPEDLERFDAVIEADRPDVIVETGTWQGGSACWFAAHNIDVITVDIEPQAGDAKSCSTRITWVVGDSADPDVAAMVEGLVAGRRAMVVLDSAHTAEHVTTEIRLYGPLVTAGCHLVVEDGIVRWMAENGRSGSPLDAVEELLANSPGWERDETVEIMGGTSADPGGWWRRAS